MDKYNAKFNQTQLERENGKDISFAEITDIYTKLINQLEDIEEEILVAIERNDYSALLHLVKKRKNIHAAIESIEPLYRDESKHQDTCINSILQKLKDGADITEASGKELLDSIRNSIEKLNYSSQKLAEKTLETTSKSISVANHLSHRTAHYFVKHTVNGLRHIADFIQKNS